MNAQITTLEKQISDNKKQYRESRESIQSDITLSDKGKNKQVDALYTRHSERHSELWDKRQNALNEVKESASKKLFSLHDNGTPSDLLSYDDKVFQFEREEPKMLASRLKSSSSIVTQKAIAKAVWSNSDKRDRDELLAKQYDSVFDTFATMNPSLAGYAQTLVDHQSRYGTRMNANAMMNEKAIKNFER